jgi:hypothetical protein
VGRATVSQHDNRNEWRVDIIGWLAIAVSTIGFHMPSHAFDEYRLTGCSVREGTIHLGFASESKAIRWISIGPRGVTMGGNVKGDKGSRTPVSESGSAINSPARKEFGAQRRAAWLATCHVHFNVECRQIEPWRTLRSMEQHV